MKKIKVMVFSLLMTGMMVYSVHAATIGYIDGQKVFSSYEKTKKVLEQLKKKDQLFQEEVAKRQKQLEKEKSKNISDGDLRKLAEKFQKELEPQRNDMMESQNKIMQEIQDDMVKATETIAKRMGVEVVMDKQNIITGGKDITEEVIKQLNNKQ